MSHLTALAPAIARAIPVRAVLKSEHLADSYWLALLACGHYAVTRHSPEAGEPCAFCAYPDPGELE